MSVLWKKIYICIIKKSDSSGCERLDIAYLMENVKHTLFTFARQNILRIPKENLKIIDFAFE